MEPTDTIAARQGHVDARAAQVRAGHAPAARRSRAAERLHARAEPPAVPLVLRLRRRLRPGGHDARRTAASSRRRWLRPRARLRRRSDLRAEDQPTSPSTRTASRCRPGALWVVLCGTAKCCARRAASLCGCDDEDSSQVARASARVRDTRRTASGRTCVCGVRAPRDGRGVRGSACACVDPTDPCYTDHYAGECGCTAVTARTATASASCSRAWTRRNRRTRATRRR